MKTRHQIFSVDSRRMEAVADESIHLVVTSPPYPMIAMWDADFAAMDESVGGHLEAGDGRTAFELMHRQLDAVWGEIRRILTPGGTACINVGDAVRKVGDDFSLYPNHARILSQLVAVGFTPLPAILWRKPTNAPTKFMGSGMLPAGAYVTLEHEYILIVRKGSRRVFVDETARENRRQSAIFWEERNRWYSDVWSDVVGAGQMLTSKTARRRSAAFPMEIPYRLINMFSVKGDLVLDPFVGTGTTLKAAAAAARNSLGLDLDPGLSQALLEGIESLPSLANAVVDERLQRHREFVQKCAATKRALKHFNRPYRFPVVTGQETELFLNPMLSADLCSENVFEATYRSKPESVPDGIESAGRRTAASRSRQLSIFKH